jgi:hypothetical protein
MDHRSCRSPLRLVCVALAAVATIGIAPARGQYGVWRADSLLAAGRLTAAESSYFAVVSAYPRDPRARSALGSFLAARGSTIAGIVLLEEARDFGADSGTIARALAPLYAQRREYAKLLELEPQVLSAAQRRQADWLRSHPPAASLPDSVVLLTYRVVSGDDGIGSVAMHIGRAQATATIDPRVSGLVLPAPTPELRSFGADGQLTVAVAPVVRIGAVTLTNVPTTIGNSDDVRLGFDVLARLSPTFDPVRGTLLLRREIPPHTTVPIVRGTHVPALFDTNGLRLLFGGRWNPSSSDMAAMLLASRPWTWDVKRGDVVLLTSPAPEQ